MPFNRIHAALLGGGVALLSACAGNYAEQGRQLQSSDRCCTALAQLTTSQTLGATALAGALDRSTAITALPDGRAPAMSYALPADAAGRVLELTALSDIGPITEPSAAVFVPLAATFLDRVGQPLPAGRDTGYLAANGGLSDPFLVSRQYRVPAGAARVVVHADPTRFGARQTMDYQARDFLMPAGGLYIPTKGREAVTAIWSVYGAYRVHLRGKPPGA